MKNIGEAFSDSLRGVARAAESPEEVREVGWLRSAGGGVLGLAMVGLVADIIGGHPTMWEVGFALVMGALGAMTMVVGALRRRARGDRLLAVAAVALAASFGIAVGVGSSVEQLVAAAVVLASGIQVFGIARIVGGAGLERVFAIIPLLAAASIVVGIATQARWGDTYDALWLISFAGVALLGFVQAFSSNQRR